MRAVAVLTGFAVATILFGLAIAVSFIVPTLGILAAFALMLTLAFSAWYSSAPHGTCGAVLATGNGHTATCILPAGHVFDCATTVKALETVGYCQTPF